MVPEGSAIPKYNEIMDQIRDIQEQFERHLNEQRKALR
jgi:hypothetical protein